MSDTRKPCATGATSELNPVLNYEFWVLSFRPPNNVELKTHNSKLLRPSRFSRNSLASQRFTLHEERACANEFVKNSGSTSGRFFYHFTFAIVNFERGAELFVDRRTGF